jgi:hypothetical protein
MAEECCKDWEEIQEFVSPGEFLRFKAWLEETIAAGLLRRVSVEEGYTGSDQWDEQWVMCCECGQKWRIVAPEFPFKGVFVRIADKSASNRLMGRALRTLIQRKSARQLAQLGGTEPELKRPRRRRSRE